jgi:hypothetical protein
MVRTLLKTVDVEFGSGAGYSMAAYGGGKEVIRCFWYLPRAHSLKSLSCETISKRVLLYRVTLNSSARILRFQAESGL